MEKYDILITTGEGDPVTIFRREDMSRAQLIAQLARRSRLVDEITEAIEIYEKGLKESLNADRA